MWPTFRYKDGMVPNTLALSYATLGYALGLAMVCADAWVINGFGVVLLAHAMVIAAYLVHECAHNTIFADNEHNARLGAMLNWLTGGCYGRYQELRHKHFRHHVDKADVVSFDYRRFLDNHSWLKKVVVAAEWAYIPAVEIMMHAFVIVVPFTDERQRQNRSHVAMVLSVRVLLLLALAVYSLKAVMLYAMAYGLFLTVLRFMDAHQHTYEVFETLDEGAAVTAEKFDSDYEYRNTFSNLLSQRYPHLNLLTLNFSYHNAHHTKPTQPWYRLPALHRELYGGDQQQVLAGFELLKSFHRNRVRRVLNADRGDIGVGAGREQTFVGVDGVSFLTAI